MPVQVTEQGSAAASTRGAPADAAVPGAGALTVMFSNFTRVPDPADPAGVARLRGKVARDYPWLLSEPRWNVVFSGLGEGWSGRAAAGGLSLVGRWRARGRGDWPRAWLAHLADGWALARDRGRVVIVASGAQAGLGAALLRRLRPRSVRLVVRFQGHSASREGRSLAGRLRFLAREAAERFVARTADLAVPMGGFTQALATRQGVPEARCILIPFPVPWADEAEVAALADPPTAVYVGRLSREKGVGVLLDAWPQVLRALPGARLLIVGDGPLRATLEARAATPEMAGSVRFTGWVTGPQLRDAYRAAWAVVLPTLCEEGLGMVLVEAGLMGRAVVGSNSGGIRDVAVPGRNGALVPTGDAPALAGALTSILGSRETATRLGLEGPAVARAYLEPREAGIAGAREAFLRLLRPSVSR